MNRDDFVKWLKHLRTRFTNVDSWLSKFPDEKMCRATDISLQDVLRAWFELMEKHAASDAMQVNTQMHKGDVAFPDSFDQIPAAVSRQCSRLEIQRVHNTRAPHTAYARERTYKCNICRDDRGGWVSIWTPESVAWVALCGESWTEELPPNNLASAACRCWCCGESLNDQDKARSGKLQSHVLCQADARVMPSRLENIEECIRAYAAWSDDRRERYSPVLDVTPCRGLTT